MASALPPEIVAKVKEVTALPYKEQAIFYLNAFWNEGAEQEAESVWELVEAFSKEDHVKGKNGNELNPIQAFHILQARNQTLTALELKAQLRKVDIDANGELALVEYTLFYPEEKSPIKLITNPQGDVDPVKLAQLEENLNNLNQQFEQLQVQLDEQKKAEAAAKAAEEQAVAQETAAKAAEQVALDEEAKAKAAEAAAVEAERVSQEQAAKAADAEAALQSVEDEARAIEAQIKAEEKAKADNIARLEALSQDQTVGIVKRNMAVQQLAQARGEDSLPLQKAKLTQEAVVRRLKKATEAAAVETKAAQEKADAASAARAEAAAAREAAEQRRAEAVAAREAAEQRRAEAVAAAAAAAEATKAVEASIVAVKQQLAEVQEELAVLKASTGTPQGLIWWKARELEEKKKSLPKHLW